MSSTDHADAAPIPCPPLCGTHQYLLVHQCGYGEDDPWRALCVAAQITLFQGALADPRTHKELGGDVRGIAGLGCLGCYKPDVFGVVVQAGQGRPVGDLSGIKAVGDKYAAPTEQEEAPIQ